METGSGFFGTREQGLFRPWRGPGGRRMCLKTALYQADGAGVLVLGRAGPCLGHWQRQTRALVRQLCRACLPAAQQKCWCLALLVAQLLWLLWLLRLLLLGQMQA